MLFRICKFVYQLIFAAESLYQFPLQKINDYEEIEYHFLKNIQEFKSIKFI